MDSYILRIYHRDAQGPRAMVGMLESPDGKTRYVFRNVEELWSALQIDPMEIKPALQEQDDRNLE